jgi:hypothetical protein
MLARMRSRTVPASVVAVAVAIGLALALAPCALVAGTGAGVGVADAAACAAPVASILRLADQRLGLMRDVAAWKWQHHAAVTAPAREQAVIHHAAQLAGPLGLPPTAVAQLSSAVPVPASAASTP